VCLAKVDWREGKVLKSEEDKKYWKENYFYCKLMKEVEQDL
jgi:hypothetical protein